jgi:hypothetical protein
MKNLRTIFLLLLWATTLLSAKGSVEVRPGNKELIETDPLRTVTTVFHVTNTGSPKQYFIPQVELPEGWRLITNDFEFELDKNESEIKLVSFFVPQTALAGRYEITYRIRGREFPEIGDFYKVQVLVLPVKELKVYLFESPKYAVANDEYQNVFVVVNESNAADSIDIEVRSDRDYPCQIDCPQFKLQPGESRYVTVHVKTRNHLVKKVYHRLQFTARLHDDKQVKTTAFSIVEMYPRISGKEDKYHRVPTKFSLRYVAQTDSRSNSGLQGEYSGKGTLNEAGNKFIDFRFRGPDIYETSILAEYDEYVISYWTQYMAFHIGDRNYSLTPLLENARYGRGVGSGIQWKKFQLGSYYLQTRWLRPREDHFAAFLKYRLKKNNTVGIHYLRKKVEDEDGNVVSLESQLEPIKNTSIELELAAGENNDKNQNGYRAKLNTQQKWFVFFLNLIRADSKFPGYYRDTKLFSSSLSLSLRNNLRLNGSYRNEKQNFDVDTTRYSAPYTEYKQIGLYYRPFRNTNFTFDLVDNYREDRFENPKFHYDEISYRLGIRQAVNKFNFQVTAAIGETENYILKQTRSMSQYTFSFMFDPNQNQNYRGYLYYDDNIRYSGEKEKQLTVGAYASIRIGEKSTFNLNFQNNYSPEESYRNRNLFEVQFKQTLPNEHRIVARVRHSLLRFSTEKKETAALIEYTVPIGIPVAHKKNTGIVKGHVHDAQTGLPVKDLILRINGSTAVTDKNGYFVFPALKPNSYFLSLDKAVIGLNRVTVQKTPMDITVRGGDEQVIDLNVTDGATFSGQVMVYTVVNDSSDHFSAGKMHEYMDDYYVAGNGKGKKSNNIKNGNGKKTYITNGKTKLVKDYPLQQILVELKREDEVQRRITDFEGRFLFEELRPGKWTMKIYSYNVPEYYHIQKELVDLEFKPGEKAELEVKVVPKRRKIQFLQEGGTLMEETEE